MLQIAQAKKQKELFMENMEKSKSILGMIKRKEKKNKGKEKEEGMGIDINSKKISKDMIKQFKQRKPVD